MIFRSRFLTSLRFRLIAVVVAIQVVTAALLVWNSAGIIRDTHTERLNQTARSIVGQFTLTAGAYLFAYDYAALEELADAILRDDEVSYVALRDADGRLVVASGPVPEQFRSEKAFSAGRKRDSGFELISDIVFGGRRRGAVLVGFSTRNMHSAVADQYRRGGLIAAASILFAIAAAFLIGFGLTRNVAKLADAARRFGRGDETAVADISGHDEIALAAATFNRMIDERKRFEAAMRESEERFSAIFNHSPTAISLREPGGRYLLLNRKFEEWYGITHDQVVGKTLFDVFPRELARKYAELDQETLDAKEAVHLEREMRFADGRMGIMSVTKFPVLDGEGKAIGIGAIHVDITAQRQLEQQLRESQKLEAIGQLTGGVAHEFNNLLMVIMGNTELLDQELGDNEALREYTSRVIRSARHGAALTRSLLAYSRKQNLDVRAVELGGLVGDMRDMLQRTLGETITIEIRVGPELWRPLADVGQLEAALLNLALNARDAMPRGGAITITGSNRAIGPDDAAKYDIEAGDYVMLEVADTGRGIPADLIDRVFEPFFTTKEIGKGTGLGLSMVYGFARQSKGFVEIDSAVGVGTTVRLCLPRAT